MADCQTSFSTPHPLLPRLIPSGGVWEYADPLLTVTLVFSENMDQTEKPDPSDFVLTVDDVVKTIATTTWDDATHFISTYSEGTLGPSVVEVRYPTKVPEFLSIAGELVTPFDLITVPL